MYLLELDAVVDGAGTVQTLRFASHEYTTEPGESPSNTPYIDRLIEPGNFQSMMYSDLRTGGASRGNFGEFVLANTDAQLDYMIDYSFAGRAYKLLRGDISASLASFSVVALGMIVKVDFDFEKIVFSARDPQERFNQSLLTDKFLGNNSLPDGLEGTPDDLKDVLKMRLYGRAYNFTPQNVNTSKHIYYCSGIADAVFDRARALTREADYSSESDMLTNAPSVGCYRSLATGYFRLGSAPQGQITCDAYTGASAANRTVAQILKQIALDAGLSSGAIVAADVTALDTLNSAEVGIVVTGNDTAGSVMDAIANSISAWYGFDLLEQLHMGRLPEPAITPDIVVEATRVVDLERLSARDFSDGLVYKVQISYKKVWSVQTSDLDGAITDARRALVSMEYRSAVVEDSAVKAINPLAVAVEKNVLLVSAADADDEAQRLFDVFSEQHDMYKLTLKYPDIRAEFGETLELFYWRFGLAAGKTFVVLGIETDCNNDNIVYTLWA